MSTTPQQAADALLGARDEARASLAVARSAVEGVVSAICRRHRAEDAFDAARADMLEAHEGEAAARSELDRAIEQAVNADLAIDDVGAAAQDRAA
ncbi:hypothetical protein ACQ5SO_17120 [Rhodovulum sp. DZ06]|uniref:hypothetical protein n=1 Tax=Rhodovulum sp. DZ06 TaxID=3425126 RepID=UPI003D3265CF